MAMADSRSFPSLFLLIISCSIFSSYAYQFQVGGRQGWVVNPSENYNKWTKRMRFQVNDTLLFKYSKGSDSVLVVSRDDYDKCNTDNPILKLEDGNSIFKFDRSGPFYFISGNKSNCEKGQKMIIVALAVRNPISIPSASPPGGAAPVHPPSPSPSTTEAPVPSPEGSSSSPVVAPVLAPSPSQASTPSPAFSPSSTSTPGSGLPVLSPPGSIPPPPPSGSRPAFTPSAVFQSTVSLVLTVTLAAYVV